VWLKRKKGIKLGEEQHVVIEELGKEKEKQGDVVLGKKKAYSPRRIEEEEEKNGITPIAGISPSIAT
jgi:hypothetical protein